MRRCEERGEATPSTVPDKHRPLGSSAVQDSAKVVRPHVEVGRTENPVGEARPAFVEQDDPRECREPLEKMSSPGSLELDLEVPRHPERVHEVDRPFATHLIGDVHAVGRSRVAHVGLYHVGPNCSAPAGPMQR